MQARQIKWLPVLMAVTITGIAAFQVYWLAKTYEREERTLERSSNITFRETVHRLQAEKLKLDGITFDSAVGQGLQPVMLKRGKQGYDVLKPVHRQSRDSELQPVRVEIGPEDKVASLVNVLSERVKDTATDRTIVFNEAPPRDSMYSHKLKIGRRARLMQFLYAVDSLQDTLRVPEIHAAFERRMQQQNLAVPFTINRLETDGNPEPQYNEVTLGFAHPITYQLELGNTTPYLLKRIGASILLSFFIVGFTLLSFSLLYRNLRRQRRLADIKNEFISNITHELKTPIATVKRGHRSLAQL
jgi:two-component system phosphate regulon sensor histidine kinase PhoR